MKKGVFAFPHPQHHDCKFPEAGESIKTLSFKNYPVSGMSFIGSGEWTNTDVSILTLTVVMADKVEGILIKVLPKTSVLQSDFQLQFWKRPAHS